MANAFVINIQECTNNDSNSVYISFNVAFFGSDVPEGCQSAQLTVTVAKDSIAMLSSMFSGAIRNYATESGYSVPEGAIFSPSFGRL